MVTCQKQAKGLGRQGSLIHTPAQSPRQAGGREMLWERSTHASFPGFFNSACGVLTLLHCTPIRPPALLQKGTGRTRSRNKDTSCSQSLPQDLSLKARMKQPLDIPYQTMFIIHSKARKFFLFLDPHHCTTTAVVHRHWATTPCEGLSKKVYPCKEENMDNLPVAVKSHHFFFTVKTNMQ